MINIEFKKLFNVSKNAELDCKEHKYFYTNNENQKATADFSVTEILNKGTYVSKAMEVAAAVGSEIHYNFSALCGSDPALLPFGTEEYYKNKSPIAHACFKSLAGYLNTFHKMVERPLVGEFNIDGETITVGGTADLVTLEPVLKDEDEENRYYDTDSNPNDFEYILNVFDLKTATGESIQANWRLQVAVYIEFYKNYLTEKFGIKIVKTRGFVIRPGFSKPVIVVTEQNHRHLIDAFALKLCATRVKEVAISDKEKETIKAIKEAIDSVSETEKKFLALAKEAKEEKEKLFQMLSVSLKSIQNHSPFSSIRDGEFLITPSVTTLTLADTEYLKVVNPEGYCKTSSKVSLILNIDNVKYSIEA